LLHNVVVTSGIDAPLKIGWPHQAIIARIGMSLVAGFARRIRVASDDPYPGIRIWIKINSGFSAIAASTLYDH
jgi:hypothetical protein